MTANRLIQHKDKVLPNQPYFQYLYRDAEPFEDRLHTVLADHSRECNGQTMSLLVPKFMAFEEMSSPPWLLSFLGVLLQASGCRSLLEIGTFIGHSTMQFARMLGPDAHITTVEIGEEFAELARQNFKAAGLDHRITLRQEDARTALTSFLSGSFDAVFIDGSKQDYLDHVIEAKRLLTKNGMIIVDDVFFHGDALNDEPQTDKGRGCRKLLDYAKDDTSMDHCILPVANGLMILRCR